MGGGVSDIFEPVVDVVEDIGSSVGEAIEDVGDVGQDVIDTGKSVGDAFSPPAPPELPDIPPPPSAEDIIGGFRQEEAQPQEAAQLAEDRARRVQAGQSTIRTSSRGVLEPAVTTRTLLGS